MSTIISSLDRQIAQRIKTEREGRRWSIADLAARSGVSKAMISKVERGESSPTASLLGRLSGAFGLTVSTLLARAEGSAGRIARAGKQPVWRDKSTGFRRTAISPPGSGVLELVQGRLPAGARIAYPAASYSFIVQQIWVLKGRLHFCEGEETHILDTGDCLQLGSPADCAFENRGRSACEYLVAVAKLR
jgi:transcriptional regulator with XRE-family HTH domain